MAEKHWVDSDHYRVVSEDGRESWLYEADGGLVHPDTCIEKADHAEDGTTTAYEADNSVIGQLFFGACE